MLKEMLIEFEAVLKQYNPKGLESLEAPLLQKERESLFHELGINDSDLREIFSWRNGCAEDKGGYIICRESSVRRLVRNIPALIASGVR